jgi:oxygen-dependent protoporphyrinogen oxidase
MSREAPAQSSSGLQGGERAPFHVAVVGGGISGLSTAWYLEKEAKARGVPVACSIYETTGRWGGRILTEIVNREEGSFVVEGGPDSFLTASKPWAVELALELGLGDRLLGTNDAARKVFVLSRGKPVPLPEGVFLLIPTKLKPFLLSRLISPQGKLRMGLDLFIPPRKDPADETLADFVTRRLGAEALDKIAEPLLSGIYNAEADRQSLLATFPRFRETELLHGSLLRGMLAAKRHSRSPAPAANGHPKTMFASFRGGTEEMVVELTRRLQSTLRAGFRVQGLRREEGGSYLLELTGGPPEAPVSQMVRADAVVLAVPAYEAARLLDAMSPEASTLLLTIRYVSTGTMSLGFRQEQVADQARGFGLLIPRSERRPINAVTWSSTKFDHRAPSGCALVRVFFGGSRSPESMLLDDEQLLHTVRKELRSTLGITADPLFYRVYRWEAANPQYDVDHLARVAAIEHALPPGLWVTGSPYRGVGLPDCVRQSQVTARQVLEDLTTKKPAHRREEGQEGSHESRMVVRSAS